MNFNYGDYSHHWFDGLNDEVLVVYQLPDGTVAHSEKSSKEFKSQYPIVAERTIKTRKENA